jgi:hypothetical protein
LEGCGLEAGCGSRCFFHHAVLSVGAVAKKEARTDGKERYLQKFHCCKILKMKELDKCRPLKPF